MGFPAHPLGVDRPVDSTVLDIPLLWPEHAEHLRNCAIPAEVAETAGWRSVHGFESAELLGMPNATHPGIWIPYPNVPGYGRLRLDDPIEVIDGKKHTHTIRYLAPRASGVHIYFPPNVRTAISANETIILTEGEKKALAACANGFPTLAVGGVDAWRDPLTSRKDKPKPLVDLLLLAGHRVILAFDSDAQVNPSVRRARSQLHEALREIGAYVLVIDIPAGPGGQKQGLDDFLAAQGRGKLSFLIRRERAKRAPFIRSAKTLMTAPRPSPKSWLVEGFMRERTFTVMQAEPKSGKSNLARELGLSLALGREALGMFKVQQAQNVLFIAAEEDEQDFYFHLEAMCKIKSVDYDLLDKLHVFPQADLLLNTQDGKLRLADAIDASEAKAVILDPLRNLHDVEENSATEMSPIVLDLKRLAMQGLSVLLLHHSRKPSRDELSGKVRAISRGRGSQVVNSVADYVVTLDRVPESNTVRVSSEGGRGIKAIDPFFFRLEGVGRDGGAVVRLARAPNDSQDSGAEGPPAAKEPIGRPSAPPDAVADVLGLLARFPGGLIFSQIAAQVGRKQTVVRAAITAAAAEGKILLEPRTDERGFTREFYTLTAEAKTEVT